MQEDHPAAELIDHFSAVPSQIANHKEEVIQGCEQSLHGVGD